MAKRFIFWGPELDPDASRLAHERRITRIKEGRSREFWLVIWFLILFFFVLLLVLMLPAYLITGQFSVEGTQVSDFKKELAALIIAAFGPWIAAGAAYFFGRENMRVALEQANAQMGRSPDAILRNTCVRDVERSKIEYIVKPTDKFSTVDEKLWQEPGRWFVVYVDEAGKYIAAIDDEDFLRLQAHPEHFPLGLDALKPTREQLEEISVEDALTAIAGRKILKKKTPMGDGANKEALIKQLSIALIVSLDTSLLDAEARLNDQNKYLAIILDEEGRPNGYITTGDIRRVLTAKQEQQERANAKV